MVSAPASTAVARPSHHFFYNFLQFSIQSEHKRRRGKNGFNYTPPRKKPIISSQLQHLHHLYKSILFAKTKILTKTLKKDKLFPAIIIITQPKILNAKISQPQMVKKEAKKYCSQEKNLFVAWWNEELKSNIIHPTQSLGGRVSKALRWHPIISVVLVHEPVSLC